MAVVYRVIDTSSGAPLALKQAFLHNDATRDRELHALFEREFYILAQLKHPSVIAVYDYGIEPTGPYYTMELLDGGDLAAISPLPYVKACALLLQIASSLSLLHSRGLIHRDISPRNVRCTADGRAKLIDFGAMTPMGPCTQMVGTPAFIAPEVAHRLTLDGRTDLFSLGATLYYALTGRFAYRARTMAELREVWREDPLSPSQLVSGIPPALDELVIALLGLDPARRPRSAFEVMQRLSAIAGVAEVETGDVLQAYLSAPTLVGRELELSRFREHVRRMEHGHGGGLLFESAPGSGRSRMLDACVLEAKTLGATTLRVRGGTAESVAFASAHELATQLCEMLGDDARQAALATGAESILFDGPQAANDGGASALRLRPLMSWRGQRYALQAALASWIRRLCRDHPLLIAVDDAERVDEATLALIAALAHAAKQHAILIVATIATGAEGPLSLRVLRGQCIGLSLAPLSQTETKALFASVFGDTPHLALLSDRIYRVAAGSPRESMALAQQLLDRELVRYADGNWRLPDVLAIEDLPATVAEVAKAQLERLSPLARTLAQTQALAVDGPWSRADFAEIPEQEAPGQVDDALNALLRAGLLVGTGNAYALKSHAVRGLLLAGLAEAEIARRHLLLADLCVHSARHPLLEVHHALLGGEPARALERLSHLLEGLSGGPAIYEQYPVEPKLICATLAMALEQATAAGRPARERCELARHLTTLSMVLDTRLFYTYGPRWLEHLERDSGLADYLATDPTLPPGERLKLALERTISRYAATPEADRVYSLQPAIQLLALYVTTAIVIGSRWCDTRLLASLPGKLEPFTALTPVLHALWQNVVAGGEMNYLAQPEIAHDRVLAVYERLGQVSVRDLPNVTAIRYAITYALGVLEVSLGYPTAEHWIEIMKEHPLQQVNAMYLRRVLCLYAGDVESAETYRKQAEVLAVQASSRQMFDNQPQLELAAQVHAGDLAGVKQAADRIEQLASEVPSWRPAEHLAHGYYQRMRGDLAAAKEAFERALALSEPSREDPPANLNTWVNAAGGYTHVLIELGRTEEARAFAERSLSICESRRIGGWCSHIVRGLALAEAKSGDVEQGKARLDAFIASRTHLHPSRRMVDYEARARIAIWEKDSATALHYAELAAHGSEGGPPAMLAKHARLVEEAKQAGVDLDLPSTAFEHSVLGSTRARSGPLYLVKVTQALSSLPDRAARAQCALELVCQATRAPEGHLFIRRTAKLEPVAHFGSPFYPELGEAAASWWQEQVTAMDLTTLVTEDVRRHRRPSGSAWTSAAGVTYRFAPLQCTTGARLAHAGVVALAIPEHTDLVSDYWPLTAAIVTRLVAYGDVEPVFIG